MRSVCSFSIWLAASCTRARVRESCESVRLENGDLGSSEKIAGGGR